MCHNTQVEMCLKVRTSDNIDQGSNPSHVEPESIPNIEHPASEQPIEVQFEELD